MLYNPGRRDSSLDLALLWSALLLGAIGLVMVYSASVAMAEADIRVTLDIVPDEDNPYAMLSAHDADQLELAKLRVSAGFKLSKSSATAWIENEFRNPE